HVAPEANTNIQVQLKGLLSNWHSDNAEQYNAATIFTEAYLDDERNDQRQGAVFLALVGLVLLIACANVANLSLTRGEARVREMTVRAALGGSRTQLMRDALLEAMVLTVIGAFAGVLLMAWLVDVFPALIPQTISRIVIDVRIDARALTFTAMLSVITILLV